VLIPVIVHLTEGYNVSETRLQLLPERLGVIDGICKWDSLILYEYLTFPFWGDRESRYEVEGDKPDDKCSENSSVCSHTVSMVL
jgi:hypothetical protein